MTTSTLRIILSDLGLNDRTVHLADLDTDVVAWLVANAGDYSRADVRHVEGDKNLGKSTRYTRPLGTRDWESEASFHDLTKGPQPGAPIEGREITVEKVVRRDLDSGAYIVRITGGGRMYVARKGDAWVFAGYC